MNMKRCQRDVDVKEMSMSKTFRYENENYTSGDVKRSQHLSGLYDVEKFYGMIDMIFRFIHSESSNTLKEI